MLKLKIPPVLVTFIFTGLIWLLHCLFPNTDINFPLQKWTALILFIISGFIGLLGVMRFVQKSTTVNPHKPDNASTLVTDGIYAITRNPMYLALLILLFSLIVYLGNILSLLALPLFIWYMTAFQIKPEEEVIQQKFGENYLNYKSKVRRWI